jgi:hypothetical protein
VFHDGDAAGGEDKDARRRDVEEVELVTARAADIEERFPYRLTIQRRG